MKESDDKNKKPEMRDLRDPRRIRPETDDKDQFRRPRFGQPIPYPRREYLNSPFYPKPLPLQRKGFPEIEPMRMQHTVISERAINTTEVKSAIDFIQKVKQFYPEDTPNFLCFLEVMKDFKQGKKSIEEVSLAVNGIFNGNELLLAEFKRFMPSTGSIPKMETPEGDAVEFITEAKKKFSKEPEMYANLIKILSYLKTKPVPESKIRELKELLSVYPELIIKLDKFVPESDIKKDEDSPFNAINEQLKSINAYEPFMKCINALNQNLICKKDVLLLLRPLLGEELIGQMSNYLGFVPQTMSEKSVKFLRKEGSYRILKAPVFYENNSEILNKVCIGFATHEREDENYIFLKRNVYEETLFRIEDERFEADLVISRIESLIVSLEKICAVCETKKDDYEISLSDLVIGGAILQEIFEFIYGSAANDVLDGLLGNPKKVAPIIKERLYAIDILLREERARKMKVWEENTRNNHYKALEASFCDFKNGDKKNLSYKSLSKNMVGIKNKVFVKGEALLKQLVEEFGIFVDCEFKDANEKSSFNDYKTTITAMIEVLKKNCVFYCTPPMFCIFVYLIILLERLAEIEDWPALVYRQNKLALSLGFKQHDDVDDSKTEIVKILKDFVGGRIESCKFEEELRILSDVKGYKLFNIDKIMNKIGSKFAVLKEDSLNSELIDDIFKGVSKIENVSALGTEENYKFTVEDNIVEIEKIVNGINPESLEEIERFKTLEYDESIIARPVFLNRSVVPLNKAVSYFNVEHYVDDKTGALKCVFGTEDCFMRENGENHDS